MQKRHRIILPKIDSRELKQDEVYFYLESGEEKRKMRFHDYDEIYKIPGLYEQLFYDRLHCNSPNKVTDILKYALAQSRDDITELRVLDFGAGNGVMGETLKKQGVSRLVGVDIIPEAYEATLRDRPGVYDAYYVQDFSSLNDEMKQEISSWRLDCMVTIAALGFGDIPTEAFIVAIQDSLSSAQLKYGIFDPEAQTEYLSTLVTSTETKLVSENAKLKSYKNSSGGVARDSVAKLTANIAGLQSQLDLLQGRDTSMQSNYSIERFNKAKGTILVLDDSYKKATNTVNFDKELLKTLESAYNLQVPALHVVETAQVPVVKSRPKRTMLVLASTFAAFLFMVIGVLFIESYKHLDWSFIKEW